jgi:hypothetical protein
MNIAPSPRLALPQVTLLAVTSVNIAATVAALEASMAAVDFGAAKLLTDRPPTHLPDGLQAVTVPPIRSMHAYSDFVLRSLPDHVDTSHALLVQWDGHVLDARRWRPEFLAYDYIGARWPQFSDGHDVGNGGFSLRSRALLEACRSAEFRDAHPEDLAIARHNRIWLEGQGLRFAPACLADAFSAERAGSPATTFGYHGIWHMPRLLGRDTFWQIYSELDERTSARHDFRSILWQMMRGRSGLSRAVTLIRDQLCGPV